MDDFETLMEYAAQGRSVVGLLKKRKPGRPWCDRRLDQQIGEVTPPIRETRVQERFEALFGSVVLPRLEAERARVEREMTTTDATE